MCFERQAYSCNESLKSNTHGSFNALKFAYKQRKKIKPAFPILQTSAKSVQTSAEVSRKYYVLTNLTTCTH